MPIKINKGTVQRDITGIEYPVWRKGIHFIKSPFCRTIRINYAYTDKQFKNIDIKLWSHKFIKDIKNRERIEMTEEEKYERWLEECDDVEIYEPKRKSDYL